MRSLLLASADWPIKIEADADGLIFDLAHLTGHDIDRIGEALKTTQQKSTRPRFYVLLRDLAAADDALDAMMPAHPDGIVLSKAQNGADIQQLSVKLAVREAELGLAEGTTDILAMAGTAAALFELGSFAGASARLRGLIFAQESLAEALGIASRSLADGRLPPPMALARNLVLLAAKAAKVPAIDAALLPETDDANLRAACERARAEGFSGKLVTSPGQVAILNAIFAKP